MIVSAFGANKRAIQRKIPFKLGTRTPVCIYTDKKEIAKAPVQAYYKPKRQTVLQQMQA